jgi:hypothetical protein
MRKRLARTRNIEHRFTPLSVLCACVCDALRVCSVLEALGNQYLSDVVLLCIYAVQPSQQPSTVEDAHTTLKPYACMKILSIQVSHLHRVGPKSQTHTIQILPFRLAPNHSTTSYRFLVVQWYQDSQPSGTFLWFPELDLPAAPRTERAES